MSSTKSANKCSDKIKPRTEVISCAYCGFGYEPGTPASRHEALTEHIKQCPEHPMSKHIQELSVANQEIKELKFWKDVNARALEMYAESVAAISREFHAMNLENQSLREQLKQANRNVDDKDSVIELQNAVVKEATHRRNLMEAQVADLEAEVMDLGGQLDKAKAKIEELNGMVDSANFERGVLREAIVSLVGSDDVEELQAMKEWLQEHPEKDPEGHTVDLFDLVMKIR